MPKTLQTFVLVAMLSCVMISGSTQESMPEARQKPQHLETEVRTPVKLSYLLFLPKEYEATGTRRWPLMLFLHGAGERGSDLNRVKVHGPPKIVESSPGFPFILVSPQCPSNRHWSNEELLALLDEVMAKHQVDTSRVYLTGLSMGGFGTWNLGIAHPERFAAILPICGGGDFLPVVLAGPDKRKALSSLGIWAFHGARDEVVPLAESQRMINALKRIGLDPKLTVYPEAGHDSWTETYDNPEIYRWFLNHRREPAK
jgi:predicted peptidase